LIAVTRNQNDIFILHCFVHAILQLFSQVVMSYDYAQESRLKSMETFAITYCYLFFLFGKRLLIGQLDLNNGLVYYFDECF
jgi:hypothetical protein